MNISLLLGKYMITYFTLAAIVSGYLFEHIGIYGVALGAGLVTIFTFVWAIDDVKREKRIRVLEGRK